MNALLVVTPAIQTPCVLTRPDLTAVRAILDIQEMESLAQVSHQHYYITVIFLYCTITNPIYAFDKGQRVIISPTARFNCVIKGQCVVNSLTARFNCVIKVSV